MDRQNVQPHLGVTGRFGVLSSFDEPVKSRNAFIVVIPAKAGASRSKGNATVAFSGTTWVRSGNGLQKGSIVQRVVFRHEAAGDPSSDASRHQDRPVGLILGG